MLLHFWVVQYCQLCKGAAGLHHQDSTTSEWREVSKSALSKFTPALVTQWSWHFFCSSRLQKKAELRRITKPHLRERILLKLGGFTVLLLLAPKDQAFVSRAMPSWSQCWQSAHVQNRHVLIFGLFNTRAELQVIFWGRLNSAGRHEGSEENEVQGRCSDFTAEVQVLLSWTREDSWFSGGVFIRP